jgi:hypothetical protein
MRRHHEQHLVAVHSAKDRVNRDFGAQVARCFDVSRGLGAAGLKGVHRFGESPVSARGD